MIGKFGTSDEKNIMRETTYKHESRNALVPQCRMKIKNIIQSQISQRRVAGFFSLRRIEINTP